MDLQVKDVAELLNLSETTILKWLSEGKIPSYKLNEEHRFNRAEIEDWVMHQKLGVEKKESGNRQWSLFRALNRGETLVLPSHITTKEEAIAAAMHYMSTHFELDADVLTELFLDREKLMSTGIGEGIGVPHTRDFLLDTHFDVVLVVYPEKPLSYGSLDGQPVHTLFFLFACEDVSHLHLLSKIAHLSSGEKARAFLRTKPSKERLLDFIKQWESTLNG